MSKAALIFIVQVMAGLSLAAQTVIPAGNVTGTWAQSGSPYLVQGIITIPDGQTLTIEPGCDIKFEDSCKLIVDGRLLAQGSVSDSIIFTATDTTLGWFGIDFLYPELTNDTSVFTYCRFDHAKNGPDLNQCGGAFYISDYGKVKITHCLIRDNSVLSNGGGIYVSDGSPVIQFNEFRNNSAYTGGGLYMLNSQSRIISNTFVGNKCASRGGGMFCFGTKNIISKNSFISNSSEELGGGLCLMSDSTIVISDNIFIYNTATIKGGGIHMSFSDPDIISNIIANNYAQEKGGGIYCAYYPSAIVNNEIVNNEAGQSGGGIYSEYCTPVLTSNTLCNNYASTFGGAIYFYLSNSTLTNCLISNNTADSAGMQIYIQYYVDKIHFLYCNVQNDSSGFGMYNNQVFAGSYLNNIDSDPMFVAPPTGSGIAFDGFTANWQLTSSSPCIDAGNPDSAGLHLPVYDIDGNMRIFNSRIDIGAYEYVTSSLVSEVSPDISLFPNPCSNTMYIHNAGNSTFEIYDSSGRRMISDHLSDSNNKIDLAELLPGVYIVIIKSDKKTSVHKLVKQ